MEKKLHAVLFDLDGTLGNTLPLCIAAFRSAIEPLAERLLSDEEIVATFGPSEEGTIQALIPQAFQQGVEGYLYHYAQLHDQLCPAPFEGVRELLEWLRKEKVHVGMVTGKGRRSCDITLQRFGLQDLFEVVETGSPKGERKADGMRAALGAMQIEPEQAVYIGDAPADITSSRRAGLRIFAAAWAETADIAALERQQSDALCHSVEQLRQLLETELQTVRAV